MCLSWYLLKHGVIDWILAAIKDPSDWMNVRGLFVDDALTVFLGHTHPGEKRSLIRKQQPKASCDSRA